MCMKFQYYIYIIYSINSSTCSCKVNLCIGISKYIDKLRELSSGMVSSVCPLKLHLSMIQWSTN